MSDDKKKPNDSPDDGKGAPVTVSDQPLVKKADDWDTLDPEVQGRILLDEQNSFDDSWTIFVAGGPKG